MRAQSDTRASILDAVIFCLKENLSAEPQLTQIAARAGIFVRTLNRYYPNKEDMFCLAYLRFLQKKYDAAVQRFEAADLSDLYAYEQLFAFFKRMSSRRRSKVADGS